MNLNQERRSKSISLVEQVVNDVTCRIDTQALRPGMRLPSVRGLALSRGISTFTVTQAYDRLVAMGYLVARPGSGFYVAARRMPGAEAKKRSVKIDAETAPADDGLGLIGRLFELGEKSHSLAAGWLPAGWLDEARLRRALRAAAGSAGSTLVGYGEPAGYAPLRDVLRQRMSECGILADLDQIVTTAGATHAIDLIAQLLIQPGNAVLVDDPGHLMLFSTLRRAGAKLIGVPWEPDGPNVDAFKSLLSKHRPKTFFTNTVLHNPTGSCLSHEKAFRILQLAEEFDLTLIEDDCYADFMDADSPRLATLDGFRRVIYVGSFSKTVSANMRVGFVAAKAEFANDLCDRKIATGLTTCEVVERTIYHFLTMAGYRQSMNRLRSRLHDRAAQSSQMLEEAGFELYHSSYCGMFLWARLPCVEDAALLARESMRAGFMLATGFQFRPNHERSPWMRFNIAGIKNGDLPKAIARHARQILK